VNIASEQVWAALAGVPDPEIPAISIVDLGIVRGVECSEGHVRITVTPTYSGCPATEMIRADICAAVASLGVSSVEVDTQLVPAWTTDWLSPATRARLKDYGIVPPATNADGSQTIHFHSRIRCPRCNSTEVEEISAFGSTACKALHRCLACREPFEYFKPI